MAGGADSLLTTALKGVPGVGGVMQALEVGKGIYNGIDSLNENSVGEVDDKLDLSGLVDEVNTDGLGGVPDIGDFMQQLNPDGNPISDGGPESDSGGGGKAKMLERILPLISKIITSDIKTKNVMDSAQAKSKKMSPLEYVQFKMNNSQTFSPKDVAMLLKLIKGYDNYEAEDMPYWRDDVLDGYIDHIRNYKYQYKPEATAIDPTLNPETEHIGPMAQDIEAVNPAAVKKGPEGFLSVDTGRLALMNAGVIADLARRIEDLEALVRKLGG